MVLRSATAWTAAVLLVSVVGCASSRGRTTQATVAPQTAQTVPPANPHVRTEQLIHIGDTLRMQGKYQQAAEVYGWVLDREPNNLAARQRMASLPINVAHEPPQPPPDREALRPRMDEPPLTHPPSAPPVPVSPPQPSQPPPAPPVIEDVPVIPAPSSSQQRAQLAPGVFDSATTPYQAASELPYTLVRRAAGSGDAPLYTIQVIPASKGGVPHVQELKVSDEEPAAPGPFRAPVQRTAKPVDANDGSHVRPTAGIARPPLPPGLRELRIYLDQPKHHVPEIASRLQDGSAEVRSLAAFLLGRAGENARPAVPVLEALLSSEQNGPTRIRVAEALLRIDPQHRLAVETLMAGLSSSERAVRWEAVCVSDVIKTAPPRTVALKKVIDRLQDVESRIQVMAALKLGEATLDEPAAEVALKDVLQNPQSTTELKDAAKVALAALRAESSAAVRNVGHPQRDE